MTKKQFIYYGASGLFTSVALVLLQSFKFEFLNSQGARTILGITWWVGNILDIATTFFLIKRFGKESELNILITWFMEKFGSPNGLLFFKIIVLWIIYLTDLVSPDRSIIVIFSFLVWAAVFWNSYQLIRYKGKNPSPVT